MDTERHGPGPDKPAEASSVETQKPRWRFSDLFKKAEQEPAAKSKADKPAEAKKAKEVKPDERRAGADVLQLLGLKRALGETDEAVEPRPQPDNAKAEPEAPGSANEERLSIAERALSVVRGVGRMAVGLVRETREEVRAADRQEKDGAHTDTAPLDAAEANVEEALEEVDAAGETVERSYTSDGDGGGDYQNPRIQHEAAVAAEYRREIDKAVEAKLKRDDLKTRIRNMGIVAVGAGLLAAGKGAIDWVKLRDIRREQQRAKKRDERQRHEILEQREKIDRLLHKQVDHMDRTERQEHVHAVSDYANLQAERIREAARTQERLAKQAVGNVVRRVTKEAAEAGDKLPQPRLADRLAELVGIRQGAQNPLRKAGSAFGVVAAGVAGMFTGQRMTADQRAAAHAAKQAAKQQTTTQTWLNGLLLVLGVVLMIVILLAIA